MKKLNMAFLIKLILDLVLLGLTVCLILAIVATVLAAYKNEPIHRNMEFPVTFHANQGGEEETTWHKLEFLDAEISEAEGFIRIPKPNWLVQCFESIFGVAFFGILIITVVLLRRVFITLAAGSPFIPVNGRRIRLIALVLLGGELILSSMFWLWSAYVVEHCTSEKVTFIREFKINWDLLFVVLILLAIAEVFRMGTELKTEQELTI